MIFSKNTLQSLLCHKHTNQKRRRERGSMGFMLGSAVLLDEKFSFVAGEKDARNFPSKSAVSSTVLPRKFRLSRTEILGRKAKETHSQHLILRVFPLSDRSSMKFSFMFPKKHVKSAVFRNTLRRWGYEVAQARLLSISLRAAGNAFIISSFSPILKGKFLYRNMAEEMQTLLLPYWP